MSWSCRWRRQVHEPSRSVPRKLRRDGEDRGTRASAGREASADPEVRAAALETALEACRRRLEQLAGQNQALQARLGSLRYRVADRLHALCARVLGHDLDVELALLGSLAAPVAAATTR